MVRRLRSLVVAAALAAPVATARDARAVCGYHGDRYLSPGSGMPLPPDPHLLLLRADGATGITALADGRPVELEARVVGEGAWLLQIATGPARMLEVAFDERTYRYPIDRAWTKARGRLAGSVRVEYKWSCSFTDAIVVAVESNAIGFRASWAGDHPGSTHLPTFQELSWQPDVRRAPFVVDGAEGPAPVAPPRYAAVQLGHESCHPWNVPSDLYASRGTVWLTALHADGSSDLLGPVRLAGDLAIPAHVTVIDVAPPAATTPAAAHHLLRDPRLLLGLALAGALAGLLFRRRPRRPTLVG